MRRLGFVTAVIALLLLLLLLAQRNGAFEGLGDEDFWLLVSRIIMLVFVGAFVLMTFRERFARVAASLAVWLLIGLGVAVGYTYRFDLRDVGERLLGEFLPGYAATRGRVVEVARASGGGFSVVGADQRRAGIAGSRHWRKFGGAHAGGRQGRGTAAGSALLYR